jgi:hypothetical protein
MASTNVVINRFYPQLSDLITIDDLPEFLNFAQEGLASFLGSVKLTVFSPGSKVISALSDLRL